MDYHKENIDLVCNKWNWSRDKLGEKAQLGRGAVASYVQGKANPSVAFLWMLERMTGIPMARWMYSKIERAEIPEQPRSGWRNLTPADSVSDQALKPPTKIQSDELGASQADYTSNVEDEELSIQVQKLEGEVAVLKEVLKEGLDKNDRLLIEVLEAMVGVLEAGLPENKYLEDKKNHLNKVAAILRRKGDE